MPEVLRIAASVTTPLALLGVIAAFAYFAYIRKLKHEERKLLDLPPEKRAGAVDEYLKKLGVTAKGISPEGRLLLIRDDMEKRHRKSMTILILAATVLVVCFGMAVAAYAF